MDAPDDTPDTIIRMGPVEIRYLVDGSARQESGMLELRLPPHAALPPAAGHEGSDEVLYIIAGRLRYTVDGVERELGPGETAVTRPGAVRGFANPGDETARVLVVLTPDPGPGFFRAAAAAAARRGDS